MVDKIQKALNKLDNKIKKNIKQLLFDLKNSKLKDYDIKKLKGHDDIYRIRKGKIRIIYKTNNNGEIHLLTIERRSDITYNL